MTPARFALAALGALALSAAALGDTPTPAPPTPLPSASPPQATYVPFPSASLSPTPTPAPQPVIIAPTSMQVLLGHTASVHLISPPSGIVQLSGFDGNVITAVFNPIERSIDVVGQHPGSTTITVTDNDGQMATLAVQVQVAAGKIYAATTATITGNPASREYVAEAAARAAWLVAYPQAGARVMIDPHAVAGAQAMAPDTTLTVRVPVGIAGRDYFPVNQTVTVRMVNIAQPPVPPTQLLVSDFPETLTENGTLFYADLVPGQPARLLYYHYEPPGSVTRRVLVKVQNNGDQASSVQLIAGIAGPDPNTLAVGHASTQRFLAHEAANEGQIFEVPPGITLNLNDHLLPPDNLVSGLMQMRLISGGGIRVAVVVQNEGDPLVQPISDTLLSSSVKHARGVYRVPEFFYDLAYAAGADPTVFTIGSLPLPNLVQGQVLGGDYGVKQSADVALTNPTDAEARIGMWVVPRGGRATATFIIDGQLVQMHAANAGSVHMIRQFTLAPRGYRLVHLVTMPEGGSSYPLRVMFSSSPPPGGQWGLSSLVY